MGELGELYSSGAFYRLLICRGGGGREITCCWSGGWLYNSPNSPTPPALPLGAAAETLSEHGATARKSPRLPSIFPAKAEGIDMKQREKFEVIPAEGLSAKNTIPLTSLRGIRKEAGRVYRAVANGRLPSEEGTLQILHARQSPRHADGGAGGRGDRRGRRPAVPSSARSTSAACPVRSGSAQLETLRRLKELLPANAFEPIPDPFLPAAIDDDRVARGAAATSTSGLKAIRSATEAGSRSEGWLPPLHSILIAA